MEKLVAIIMAIFAAPLLIGGAYLLSLGGSPYYLIAGVIILTTAFLLFKKHWSAYGLYALFIVATMAWALWESGFYWWALAPRVGFPLIFGLLMLLPWVSNKMRGPKTQVASNSTPTINNVKKSPLYYWGLLVSVIVGALLSFGSLANNATDKLGELNLTAANDDEQNVSSDETSANLGDPLSNGQQTPDGEWSAYGRTDYGQRYSPLDKINTDNVKDLELAWQIQTGDVKGPNDVGETTYQATPLKIGNGLYLCTPHNWVLALDADSGETLWKFDPQVEENLQRQHQTCRGVSYYAGQATSPVQVQKIAGNTFENASKQCDAKIFIPTSDAKLYALDPNTGQRCQDFGDDGALDLMHNMPFNQAGYYYSTSPPVIAGDTIIVAGAVNDNYDVNSPSGVIRAYDVNTGELLWNWDSGDPDNTAPFDVNDPTQTYKTSSPNSWSVATADEELGLAYFPMGNRTPDQLGSYRNAAEEKYATSVVALDIETGEARWVQQFVHHDLWDMDTPAQPTLLDLDTADGVQPALVVPTKQGDVYVLNRATGEPIVPIKERPAPQGYLIAGEHAAPTQPYSGLSFEPEPLTEKDMWGASLVDQMMCRIEFNQLNYDGRYTPPSTNGSLVYPGNFGTFNWGGIAVDPENGVMFGMPTYLAFTSKLIPRDTLGDAETNKGEQGVNANEGADYAVELGPFLSPLGVPCQQPPWGTIAGADLATGDIAYQRKNGTVQDLSPIPIKLELGVPGIGGPIITKGGVAFLSAATENNFRAYDLKNGDVLWNVRIPAGGQATPMTYLNSKGEQMVVLVAGGHGSVGTTIGDYVLAYKLGDQDK
ncbi:MULTISPECIES: membrane-bound PQQ-dependent dehydrogenase, glucose/quinate/shikimate family [Psychrobacter]|mgnify:FL=1|uniref:membrane-bound PQQ-dependent dehydrogenase, glucose/quinate/shikimate family n=1 Tax=Psychrobacter TaxID=497 RepID=UPI00086C0B1B|nr:MULTISPECIES: membrane-bound PQQ-dependent dehydrogenase, glucose/quinate/shikimate family [Psychrobacter]MBA6244860.1 membrane-bound PQQ-dependent dehydrogenase, glucose/quinate/shikimate family [Psychrobacter sp. Urea-trap-18]MBA6285978.1 membrane-bound PQQ-dependent dehydrogenase, glucose/quinate/shikimate family [Psychrobacter sp. Urea-trap-16]MBA6317094.1 membrane-bound PQQ-dependent dehydrogenase, glucose/quinate/shikimate family [Psychrobacter sp. Urea-trap-20]MBA6333125.1 membrane-bo|tara:strand:+ start:9208 stop:11682 length:2475 start_codon:yes stop_codon:yes gene_type:complete